MSSHHSSILPRLEAAANHFRNNAFGEAEILCRDILGRDPWNLPAKNILAGVMSQTGRMLEAIALMEEVIRIAPKQPEFRTNCAELLVGIGRSKEAIGHLEAATRLRPEHSKSWYLTGIAWEQLRNYSEAARCFQRILQIRPNDLQAIIKLGQMAHADGRTADQLKWGYAALQIESRNLAARRLVATGLFNQGQIAEVIPQLRDLLAETPGDLAIRSTLMLSLNYLPEIQPGVLLEEHLETGRILLKFDASKERVFRNNRSIHRKLRIGYVTSDFREHAVSRFLLPVFEAHDTSRFEIFAYYSNLTSDEITSQYKAVVAGWRDVFPFSTNELVNCIQEDQIDILVDLAGYSGMHRLDVFAARSAPIQVTWLGYPNTTGLPTIRYLLSDNMVDPPEEPTYTSEEVWRLPRSFCVFRPPAASSVSASPASRNGYLTFGSLHSLAKLNDEVVDLWSRALLAAPSSQLMIFRSALLPSFQPALRQRFVERGVQPDRIIMKHERPASGSHFDVYHEIDIHLDSFPWNGHTTTCEALWMGVPTITMAGNRHASRMTASVLAQIGLQDFIARSPDEFVQLAEIYSKDFMNIARLRSELRPRMKASPLMDEIGFTRELEGAYLSMWRMWCAEKPN